MLRLIKKLLIKIIDDIDAGNSNITEQEGIEILQYINNITNKSLSKYEASK